MQQLNRMEAKLNVIGTTIIPEHNAFEASKTTTPATSATSPSVGAHHYMLENSLVHSRTGSQSQQQQQNSVQPPDRLPYEKSTTYQHLTTPHKVYEMIFRSCLHEYMLMRNP